MSVSDATSCSVSGIGVAVAGCRRLVVDEHADRQTLNHADGRPSMADRLVELEIARRGARRADGFGRRRAVGAGRRRRNLRRLIAERAWHALHAVAAARVFVLVCSLRTSCTFGSKLSRVCSVSVKSIRPRRWRVPYRRRRSSRASSECAARSRSRPACGNRIASRQASSSRRRFWLVSSAPV